MALSAAPALAAPAAGPAAGAAVFAAPAPGQSTADNRVPARVQLRLAALVRAFYQPFRDGDVDAFDHVLARNWVDDPLAPGQQPGLDGFKPVVQGYRAVFPDLQVNHQAVTVAADGSSVTVLSTFTGTQRAAFLGVPATGARITFRTSDVHTVRGGRIVSTRHLEDLFGAYQQMLAANNS